MQVDSKRVMHKIVLQAPPGTPLQEFFLKHQVELENATRRTQELISEAVRIKKSGGDLCDNDLHLLFGNDPGQGADLPLNSLGKTKPLQGDTGRPPKPKKLLGMMVLEEIQDYLKVLLTWIFSKKKGLKARQYRKWPLYSKEGVLLEAATALEEWDEQLEAILPRQYYRGPHKGFQVGQGPAGGAVTRLIVACARLLVNCGEEPNDYAEHKHDGEKPTDFDELTRQLGGGGCAEKRRKRVRVESESVPLLSKVKKSKKRKKSSKNRHSSSSSSSSSSEDEDFLRSRKKQKAFHNPSPPSFLPSLATPAPSLLPPAGPSFVPTTCPADTFVRDEFFNAPPKNQKVHKLI